MVASPVVVDQSSRLGLLRRSPSFGLLFLATAGSSFGTYVAAAALTIDIQERTGSALWVAGLLIADFLPIVLIGLLFGPLVDRLSRLKRETSDTASPPVTGLRSRSLGRSTVLLITARSRRAAARASRSSISEEYNESREVATDEARRQSP